MKSLKSKFGKSLPARQRSVDVFKELDESLDSTTRQKWQAQEDKAMKYRGDYLSIYDVRSDKGDLFAPHMHPMIDRLYHLQVLQVTLHL